MMVQLWLGPVLALWLATQNTHAFCSPHRRSARRVTLSTTTSRLYVNPSPPTETDLRKDEIRADAESALTNVGWSLPADGDLTSDDPFVQAINQGIQRDFGVQLDELLNPAKVVNLERDLYALRTELAQVTGKMVPQQKSEDAADAPMLFLITEECDGGGGGDDAAALRKRIRKKEADLLIERRSVFRGWLKNVFLVQAVGSFGLSYVMATHPESLFGGFDWFHSYNMDISIKVLGYWWWWLFVVPSLRSRRPKGFEKKALDIAFLATPLVSLLAPMATKDTAIIWALNFAVVAGSYGFAFAMQDQDGSAGDDDSNQPEWLKFIFKSLDFGSGRERGARK
jgi:hypothetical protein